MEIEVVLLAVFTTTRVSRFWTKEAVKRTRVERIGFGCFEVHSGRRWPPPVSTQWASNGGVVTTANV